MATLKRAPERVLSHLTEQADGGITTDVPCRIQIPEQYQERHLANVGAEVYILGFFAIILDDGSYGVSITDAMMRITPSNTETVEIDGTGYLEFTFEAGDRVFYSTDLVQNDTLTYYIYDEHIAKGRIPWYFNYADLARIFDTAEEHAGIYLGNHAILDLIASTIARDSTDLQTLYRHVLKDLNFMHTNPPTIVPFRSVIYNTVDTTSKLIGAYFGDSVTSALVNPSQNVERIEELLRL